MARVAVWLLQLFMVRRVFVLLPFVPAAAVLLMGAAAAAATVTTSTTMNGGGAYRITNSDGRYAANYHSDENEFFEVYSPPIRTLYSQVYWKMQDAVPLPAEICNRFSKGKIMAVTGYEVDQVRWINGGGDGDGEKEEVSVPLTWAYNHHYAAWLTNSQATRLVPQQQAHGDAAANHHPKNKPHHHWSAELLAATDGDGGDGSSSEIPLSTYFSEGNGGEFRRSYHGYPSGYAQLVESPDTFRVVPMQIDTWNRDHHHPDDAEFHPGGPLPRSSRIPAANAGYSGLIECPCSDRLEIQWNTTYAVVVGDDGGDSAMCTGKIRNASECFAAVARTVPAAVQIDTVSETSLPGCSVQQHDNGTAQATWNAAPDDDGTTVAATADRRHNNNNAVVEDHPPPLVAFAHAQINVTVALEGDNATITLVGPSDRWFGVAFGSETMCLHPVSDECPGGGPYAIVVIAASGEDGGDSYAVTERRLGFHGPGSVLAKSITVVSNSVDGSNRTVVLTRPLRGATGAHHTFHLDQTSPLPIIAARGCGPQFSQHCGHGSSALRFLPVDTPRRLCRAGTAGTIGGVPFDDGRCAPQPVGDLRAQHNPTCAVQTYRGGLSCCRDGQPLLDRDQEIPWPDTFLEYRLKFRFYFQEYEPAAENGVRPASHRNLVRLYWQTEARAGEYDIEPCPTGTPPNQCVHAITSRWNVRDMMHGCSLRPDASVCTGEGSSNANQTEGIELIYAAPHCHAPSCLSMELYNADTGQLLCRVEPIVGRGKRGKAYDERGFIALPPCLWGDSDEGLARPQLLSLDTALLSVKRSNSTLPHTGEMASWQMRGVVVPRKKPTASSTSQTLTEIDGSVVAEERARHGRLHREGRQGK